MSDTKKANPQFIQIRSAHEYDTFTFPKDILYDKNLSGNALKLLLTILDYGKRPNWVLRQTHLMHATGFKRTVYDSAIECLEESGYVKRNRETKSGKYCPYDYQYSAFPIFREEVKEKIPVQVFRSGTSAVENQHYTSSSSSYVLEETTNQTQEKDLVGSSFVKLQELENIPNISQSQRTTLYKKFTHQEILTGLKAIDISKADSVFALLFSAITNKYAGKPQTSIDPKVYEVYEEAGRYLKKYDRITVGIDEDNAYIYAGMATSTFSIRDPDFKKKFVEGVKNTIKTVYNI